MKRRAIVGLAPIALLGGCGDRASLDALGTTKPTEATVAPAPEVTTEVTLGAELETLIVDRVWEQQRAAICASIDEVVDTGLFSREEAIDYGMTYVGDSDVTAAQKAHLRELVLRDC